MSQRGKISSDKNFSTEMMKVRTRDHPFQLDFIHKKENGLTKNKKPDIVRPMPSSALRRVQAFLPDLKKANVELKQRLETELADSVDIENVDGDEIYIEMNLAPIPREDASTDDDDSSDDDDASTDKDDSEPDYDAPRLGEVTEHNLRLPRVACKKTPMIQELTH